MELSKKLKILLRFMLARFMLGRKFDVFESSRGSGVVLLVLEPIESIRVRSSGPCFIGNVVESCDDISRLNTFVFIMSENNE